MVETELTADQQQEIMQRTGWAMAIMLFFILCESR